MKIFIAVLGCLLILEATAQKPLPRQAVGLPSALIEGRFYLKIPAGKGDTILGYCDTGGGYTAVYPATITRLGLENEVAAVEIEGEKIRYIPAIDLVNHPDIPSPQIGNYYKPYIGSSFFEVPEEKGSDLLSKYVPHDAFLGQFFFMGHAWTFDYLTGKIFINTRLSTNAKDENTQVLGFKKDKSGNKRFGHPRMKIEVDGRTMDVLFDTGATFILGENGKAEFGADKTSAAGSFIAKSIFDKWHKEHPDWRIIGQGELTGADMIEVPEVKIGNLTAGPVWFAKRPDKVWSEGMIGSMDKAVKGAIGGSLLQYFKVRIDYNSELIQFEK